MALKARTLVPLALAVTAITAMIVVEVASAAHPRPRSATPMKLSMVVAFNQCTSPNRTHGAPLAFPSCNPPVQTSQSVTVGEPSFNGAPANSTGKISISVKAGTAGPPEDSDVILIGQATDVRCLPGTISCGTANNADGADYTGELEGNATIRITDHDNGGVNGNDPGTVTDIPFPVITPCAQTGTNANIGGSCNITTSANGVVPGSVKDTKRGNVEIGQVFVTDGGDDGVVASTPNTVFSRQGIFIP